MPLSEKTLAEMRAGAEAVARFAGANGLTPEYMEAMVRTQQRAAWLKDLEKLGHLRIERVARLRTNDKALEARTVVYVGDNTFEDPSAEMTGAWPSEVVCAQIALALTAGQGVKKPDIVSYYDDRTSQFMKRTKWPDGTYTIEVDDHA